MIADLHTHTRHSDGSSSAPELVEAARAAGVAVLAVTDHLTLPAAMDPGCACSVAADDLAALAREVAAACEGGGDVEVVFGFECDYYPGCEANIARWARGADLLLGSVHWVGPQEGGAWIDDPDDLHLWTELGPDEVWRRYVEAWCAACESPAGFDVMAHPDLPFRFANEGFSPTQDLSPLFREMAACAHDTGRRVEVSTAGLRKGVGSLYPCDALLDEFCRAQVPVTFGSDAHRACDVGAGIAWAQAHAWAHGYRSQEVPVAGEWRAVAL